MNWKLALVVLSVLVPFAALASDPAPPQSLTAGQVLRGGFVQERHLKGFNAPLHSTGHFVLVPTRGLIWRVETPFAVTTVITAAGLVQQVGGTETTRLLSTRLPFLSHLYGMLGGALGGDWHALEVEFTVERRVDNRRWQIRLTPRNADDPNSVPFSAIVAEGARFLDTVEMSKRDGDHDSLILHDQILDAAPLAADEATLFGALDK